MNEQNNLQPTEPIQNPKNSWIIILFAIFITALVVGGGVYVWQRLVLKTTERSLQEQINTLQKKVESSILEQPVSDCSTDDKYEVVLKENPQDRNKTDVYLKNFDSGTEELFMTIADVQTHDEHYHSNEYHNCNIYLIKRVGYDSYTDETWTDELWRYDSQKKGTKLYSTKGIDFRVNVDESLIAIITNETFILLDNSGKTLKSFQSAEVIADSKASPMFGFLIWGQNAIWLDNTFGPSLTGLAKIDTKAYAVTKYDLTDLPAGPEFTINVYSEKLAFSNYPALFDVDSAEHYENSDAKVNLQVYDLNTQKQQLIATSITKRFKPKWIDKNTLEYNDPNSESRVQKIID
jgi:hypothetical protein